MDQCIPAASNPLEDVAELLREELRECHHFVSECFGRARNLEFRYDETRRILMTLGTQLMRATAMTADALGRVEGNTCRQEIVVTRAALPKGGEG